jgi:hypothetical protein
LEAIRHLPNKFFEVIKLLEARDIRIRIPIQELDMLLEPIMMKDEDMESESSVEQETKIEKME